MASPVIEGPGSKVEGRRSRRLILLTTACLLLLSGVALSLWAIGLPLSWTADYDRAWYARITEAISADPQRLGGRRLYDVSRELGLNDVPWDDGNLQNRPGSFRVYHFRGFALYVSLDWWRDGVTDDMLLGRDSLSEQLHGRDLLRIDIHQTPYIIIDGINDRGERMKLYWQSAREAVERHRAEMRREGRRN